MEGQAGYRVRASGAADVPRAGEAAALLREALKEKVIGLAARSVPELSAKISDGLAVLALSAEDALAGFILVCPWEEGRWVSTSALVVARAHRNHGLARRLKEAAFALARVRFPSARLFGLTTSGTVMKVNAGMGWVPATYAEVCRAPEFWKGCEACPHHGTLLKMKGEVCFCTAMRWEA